MHMYLSVCQAKVYGVRSNRVENFILPFISVNRTVSRKDDTLRSPGLSNSVSPTNKRTLPLLPCFPRMAFTAITAHNGLGTYPRLLVTDRIIAFVKYIYT